MTHQQHGNHQDPFLSCVGPRPFLQSTPEVLFVVVLHLPLLPLGLLQLLLPPRLLPALGGGLALGFEALVRLRG